jgi:hypothetical protein
MANRESKANVSCSVVSKTDLYQQRLTEKLKTDLESLEYVRKFAIVLSDSPQRICAQENPSYPPYRVALSKSALDSIQVACLR